MLFYDFEVFKYDWLAVFIDSKNKQEHVIVNDREELKKLYDNNVNNIWVGFNNNHYDQYIFKGILLGMNPKEINDYIILDGREGWMYSREFSKVEMINYDVLSSKGAGLKTLEGFMGSDIKESDVDFLINRPLKPSEIDETIKYCRHDVEETINVFMNTYSTFSAMFDIVKMFKMPIKALGYTSARITSTVLDCKGFNPDDEFDYFFLPCIQLKKYKYVMDWFDERRGKRPDDKKKYYDDYLNTNVAGIPHNFGFGGLHGAPDHPIHRKGAIYHVDVRNYYPSLLLAWDLVTRAATNDNFLFVYNKRQSLKIQQINAKTKEESKKYKKMQIPYKLMLNALSGAMKDKNNPAFDPRNNNCMCINGQLMILDLIEHLEDIKGFELIQTNTDGLIVQIPDTDEAFNQMDDICYDWEQRCSTDKCQILLELDCISEIYQKDVNNYLWIDGDGGVERIGAYIKELSPLDYDLPIVNKAVVDYMVHKIPVEKTIRECNDLIEFQKVVKLSNKYNHVEHEQGKPMVSNSGVRVIKKTYFYPHTEKYKYKCYRVFASLDDKDGRILKVKTGKNGEKFANTPDHCFIDNDNIINKKVPKKLDKEWYIDLAKRRLEGFEV